MRVRANTGFQGADASDTELVTTKRTTAPGTGVGRSVTPLPVADEGVTLR